MTRAGSLWGKWPEWGQPKARFAALGVGPFRFRAPLRRPTGREDPMQDAPPYRPRGKDTRLFVRTKLRDMELLRAVARIQDTTVSEFVRSVALAEARRVVAGADS